MVTSSTVRSLSGTPGDKLPDFISPVESPALPVAGLPVAGPAAAPKANAIGEPERSIWKAILVSKPIFSFGRIIPARVRVGPMTSFGTEQQHNNTTTDHAKVFAHMQLKIFHKCNIG